MTPTGRESFTEIESRLAAEGKLAAPPFTPEARLAAAAQRANENATAPTVEPFTLYSPGELRHLPPVSWLIDKVLVFAFAVLYGASGVGKSFLALAWALTVATGMPWLDGSETVSGWVLYICAEGSGGVVKRLDAWSEDHGAPIPERIRFVTEAIYLDDPAVLARALATIDAMPELPTLIVIDTLARCMVGNENATADMNAFVRAVDALRKAASTDSAPAAALIVHHTGKKGDDERGSVALRGAADQMLALTTSSDGLTLEFDKTKDFEDPAPISLHLAKAAESAAIRLGSNRSDLSTNERRLLQLLSELDGSDQPSVTRLKDMAEMRDRTFHRALATLRDRGLATARHEGRATFNAITERGREQLLPHLPDVCQTEPASVGHIARPIGRSGGNSPQPHRTQETLL